MSFYTQVAMGRFFFRIDNHGENIWMTDSRIDAEYLRDNHVVSEDNPYLPSNDNYFGDLEAVEFDITVTPINKS